jgi:hypothetical protein
MRARQLAVATLALATLAFPVGCRDGVQPFTLPEEPSDTSSLRQLTFGIGNERDPQWSADGDSIYYHATGWYDAPGPGTLLRISPEGGAAAPLAALAQPSPTTMLTNPAAPASGGRVAYLHFARIRTPANCQASDGQDPPGYVCLDPISPEPVLDSTMLKVREPDAVTPAISDPGLAIRYPGLDPAQWSGGYPPFRQRVYPFHVDWRNGESTELRPSWSPDGVRLVYSNGVGLFTWRPGEPAATAIPNTADGVAPAWSPDGNWIAFTVIERGDSAIAECLCGPPSRRADVIHLRTWWRVSGYRLVVVRPDGTGRRELGDGRDAAWAPDSRSLFVRRGVSFGEAIYRVPLDQPGAAALVPGTNGGRMPAVSPDSSWLAFVLREPGQGDLDIWILRLRK